MKELEIGPKTAFTRFPAEVVLERDYYFLFEEDGAFKLISRTCPHAGYTVELEDGDLVCPLHGWTFESYTGRCHNVPGARLDMYAVVERDGVLIAQLTYPTR
ncbi:Rieske (2Fe-2S) protein [Paenibacillus koleovorans]|uniref:Rieske (2Fe-2S) protein n=1 Tax=Paenibacillus koleovorans TaxID=121608 RepID=UPI000FD8C83D|nr:Rieske (2Fe-2S) protein [Paenibacillus koleovorans]